MRIHSKHAWNLNSWVALREELLSTLTFKMKDLTKAFLLIKNHKEILHTPIFKLDN
jgi:hypothetical protein